YVGNDPVSYIDPFGLKVCFKGNEAQRLADSTAAATGTTFDLDEDNCATNVRPIDDDWDDVSRGFTDLTDAEYTINLIYNVGGSANRAGRIEIDQGQIGRNYGTRFHRSYCTSSSGAVWSEPSIIAHELGHAHATMVQHIRGGDASNRIAITWENSVHHTRGQPLRHLSCH
ncbi:MAG: hypothetical protein RQ723_12995, partial [Desulfuromonadales bacterium]|nr:hypothetical protein [Desulfuromonadales bacterium]